MMMRMMLLSMVHVEWKMLMTSNINFNQGNIALSLKETFLKMDELMRTPEGKNEINQLAKQNKIEESQKDTSNIIITNTIYFNY